MAKQGCWICEELKNFMCPCCHEQQQTTKQLEKEWDEQEALTQEQITEKQLELKV
jgi:hypothetical protein